MSHPRLAVVVVNHNAGAFLDACIESLRTADLEHVAVIVDNGSTDGSAERADGRYPWLRVIHNATNLGFASAANQGIRATSTPFVLLLNPDAEIIGGSLAAFIKVAEEHPRVGVMGALVRNSDRTLQPSARKVPGMLESLGHAFIGPIKADNRFSRAYTMADWDRSTEREVDWVSGSAMLLRREAFDAVGGFDEGYFMYVEDVDLCTSLRAAGWTVLFSPELEVVHETGVSSRARSRALAFEHSRSLYRFFSKHRARGWRFLLKPLVRLGVWLRAVISARKTGAR